MKLVTYATKKRPSATQVGVQRGDKIYPLKNWGGDMAEFITFGLLPEPEKQPIAPDQVIGRAPLRPGKILGIGRNYAAHAAELGNDVPETPLVFAKLTTSIIGDGQYITWSKSLTNQVDWEGELAVIIGLTGWQIPVDEAMEYVYGYTIANDVSARDLQSSDDQWARAKGLDTFCPLGPCIVTADEITDPYALTITTTVNGEVMQNGSTGLMMHKIAELIAFCSQAFTLEPGDVILTGTPAGVGKGMNPSRFLADGDEVSVSIDKIGTLTNPCMVRD